MYKEIYIYIYIYKEILYKENFFLLIFKKYIWLPIQKLIDLFVYLFIYLKKYFILAII